MHTFALTDGITIHGGNNTVTQSESEWLDLTQYEDVTFWMEIKEVTGTVTMKIQTSPTKDESFFADIYNQAAAVGVVNPGSTGGKCLMSSATVPIARFVRWSLVSASAPFDATFRIYV